MFTTTALWASLLLAAHAVAQLRSQGAPQYRRLPGLRERAQLQNGWTAQRLDQVPKLLERYGVDSWLVSQREYAEDTVFRSYKPATTFYARRRTLSFFHRNTSSLAGSPNPITWIDPTPQLWQDLLIVLEAYNPGNIAVDIDSTIAFADGLHVGEKAAVERGLGEKWSSRFISIPMIAVEFVAYRVGGTQLHWYRAMMETVWAMIDEGFSSRVVTPGKTTTTDVEWWFREKMLDLNVTTWFHPSVTRYHAPELASTDTSVIQPGDMLHVDIGITALGLNTDTQHVAYVTRPGELDVPEGLKEGLRRSNRMQDIVLSHMAVGKTGNRVLKETLSQMKTEEITGLVYCHPIGDYGHSAGSIIGLWDHQEGMPILGDQPILSHTSYSIELSASYNVSEWGIEIPFQQEEDVYWDNESQTWKWVWGRQDTFHMVKSEHFGLLSQTL